MVKRRNFLVWECPCVNVPTNHQRGEWLVKRLRPPELKVWAERLRALKWTNTIPAQSDMLTDVESSLVLSIHAHYVVLALFSRHKNKTRKKIRKVESKIKECNTHRTLPSKFIMAHNESQDPQNEIWNKYQGQKNTCSPTTPSTGIRLTWMRQKWSWPGRCIRLKRIDMVMWW